MSPGKQPRNRKEDAESLAQLIYDLYMEQNGTSGDERQEDAKQDIHD